MNPLVITPHGRAIPALDGLDVEVRRVPVVPGASALDHDRPTVIVLDRALMESVGDNRSAFESLAGVASLVGLGDRGSPEPGDSPAADLLTGYIAADAPVGTARVSIQGALRHAASLVAAHRSSRRELRSADDLQELTRIGVALSTERDLLTLLELILNQARRLSVADAGSLYLVERDENGKPAQLRFKLAQNHTLPELPFRMIATNGRWGSP